MFTMYALDLSGGKDAEVQCDSLDEAMTMLREMIESDMADPDGPRFDSYGIAFTAALDAPKRGLRPALQA